MTSAELVDEALRIAETTNAEVGSFITTFADQARTAARDADAAMASGGARGPLHGIPVGVKDILSTVEAASTAQSDVLEPDWSSGDATVVRRLRDAGAIVIGKTTTMEFAVGFPDPSKRFPIPHNPWNHEHWAGGSSSGSGSAVATGAVLGALGTDTGGSIRMPAAFCGITGLKPTFGRVPKTGCVPLGFTVDHIGPMARSAQDCALMLNVLAGPDRSDITASLEPVPDYVAGLDENLAGVRIGVDRLTRISGEHEDPGFAEAFDGAVDVLRALGADVREVELPHYTEISWATLLILLSEALAFHLPRLRDHWDDYGESTRGSFVRAALFSAADYMQAQKARRIGQRAISGLLDDVDLIVTPTATVGAPMMDQIGTLVAGVVSGPLHTVYWDGLGNPVLSVPIGFTSAGLPLGMQVAGAPFGEAGVLRAGHAFQTATNWHLAVPNLAATATSR
jgi:aspartyl-tRNA(Asn)/glutamyl-tRNA(Gln) amidotransferase subunit A